MASTRARVVTGAVVLAVYVVAAAGTGQLGGRRVLPLFEGIGPQAYRWVHPPPDFAAANVVPKRNETDLPFNKGAFPLSGATSDDSQLLLNLPAGAFMPRTGEVKITAVVTPLDPAKLGAVPPGLRADGNAYRVEFLYKPSGAEAGALATPGNVFLDTPEQPTAILHSADGRAWDPLESRVVGINSNRLGAPLMAGGYFLAATNAPAAVAKKKGARAGTAAIVGMVVVLVLVLVAAAAVVKRRRSPN